MKKIKSFILMACMVMPVILMAQPETRIEEWTGKTVLFIGAHPDDDGGSHGTMAMLQANGNEVYVMLLTTGNVGTGDPTMTRDRLAKIRRQEEVDALKELGIPEDHYLAVDAARAAEWRLIFPSQIINEGLERHSVTDYLFYSTTADASNTTVDISKYAENKVRSLSKYISQFTSAFDNYIGPNVSDLPGNEGKEFMERLRRRVFERGAVDGKPTESFRYYKGAPDGAGSRRD